MMRLHAKILIFLIIIYFSSISLHSQIAPKYSNEFLSIGIGARSLAMGSSVLASVNDVTSTYWNPAGLLRNDKQIEIGAMHSEYFAGIAKYDFLAASYKIDPKSSMGLSIIRFGVDDIPNTLDLLDSDGNIRYDRISSFSVADYAFIFSYARDMPIDGLSIGGNAKIIRRKIGSFANAWGFGVDFSAMYSYKQLRLGALLRDATSTFNAWRFDSSKMKNVFEATGNELPKDGLEITLPRLLVGVGYLITIKEKYTIYPELGFATTTDGKRNALLKSNVLSLDPSFGLELGYDNLAFLRFGISNFQRIPDFDNKKLTSFEPSLGLGINYFGIRLDYAFTNIGNQGGTMFSHVFSLSYRFDTKKNSTSKI